MIVPAHRTLHSDSHTHLAQGFIRTDMTASVGDAAKARMKEPDVPAETAVWLATLPDDGPRGGFFRFKQPIPW